MESPTARVDALMSEFRQDIASWKFEVQRLQAEGRADLVKAIECWTLEAERVLARWEA